MVVGQTGQFFDGITVGYNHLVVVALYYPALAPPEGSKSVVMAVNYKRKEGCD